MGLSENRIAVRFAYEYHDDSGNWFRAYGNENWEPLPAGSFFGGFRTPADNADGKITTRPASETLHDLPFRTKGGNVCNRTPGTLMRRGEGPLTTLNGQSPIRNMPSGDGLDVRALFPDGKGQTY